MSKLVDIFNNKELTPVQRAQSLVDLQVGLMKKASEEGSQLFATQQEAWQTETRNDPEIGGAKLDENLANISKLVDTFGSPTLRQVMDVTGAGNHPEMVRFLAKIAKLATESRMLPAGNPPVSEKSQAERMYPSMQK